MSVKPAINTLLYAILAFFISLLVTAILLGPAITGSVVLFMNEQVLIGAVVLIGGMCLSLPILFYLALGLQLGIFAAAVDNRMPMDALRISWSAAKGLDFSYCSQTW